MNFGHNTVLKNEAVEMLNVQPGKIYVDATLGGGGHSLEIIKKLTGKGHLFCFDQDEKAIEHGRELFADFANVTIIQSNFVNLHAELEKLNVEKIDGIIFDLGVSSEQIDQAERGFSYRFSGPLDMRMDKSMTLTAKEVVNTYSVGKLIAIFDKYGEEKNSKVIARAIDKRRKISPLNTTSELNELILSCIPRKDFYNAKSHPSKRVFQALRIEVNKELDVLKETLETAFSLLNKDGVISVITFHSLEDRICKTFFKSKTEVNESFRNLPIIPEEYQPPAVLINRKPVYPSELEIKNNSRARSAKLRGLKKVI